MASDQQTPGRPQGRRAIARARRREAAARGWRQFRTHRGGMAGLAILVFFALVALLAPVLFPPETISVTQATGELLAPPSGQYWLGTDDSGRSMLALLAWGARVSLTVGIAATLISMVIGTSVGIASGHYTGFGGATLQRLTDWVLVIPFLPLAIVLATVLGGGSTLTIIVVIGVTSWAGTARLIRAQTLSVEGRPYLERSRALGSGNWHQMTRHVLPNVFPLVLTNTTLTVAIAILSETTLSFLGLGDPLRPSWGSTLDQAFSNGAVSAGAWWYIGPPGLCVVLVVLSFTMIGRALEQIVNPRLGGSDMAVLELQDVSVTYRSAQGAVPAVRGVSLSVDAGRSLGLAGESGSGKTTVTSTVLRLLPKSATVTGQVLLDGEDVLTMRWGRLRAVRWATASVVFQGAMHALNPVQRVGHQIAEPIRLHEKSVSEPSAKARVGDLLEQVGLPSRVAESYPHQLSGGQKQRVMIAMALACGPRLIVADEPTTALDVMVQQQVLEVLAERVRDLGLAMVFISHDLSVLASACDELAVMYAGQVVEQGPAGQVFEDAHHPYSRALGAAFPRIGDQRFRYAPSGLPGDPPFPGEAPSGCAFHPRCPVARDECSTTDVDLRPSGERRWSSCLFAPEVGS